jgi:hypothetical protein
MLDFLAISVFVYGCLVTPHNKWLVRLDAGGFFKKQNFVHPEHFSQQVASPRLN